MLNRSDIIADIIGLEAQLQALPIHERLKLFRNVVSGKIVLSTAFGAAGQVISDIVLKEDIDIEIATVDTGRLFPETYDLMARMQTLSDNKIKIYYPDHEKLQAFVSQKGINGFYDSVETRQNCCHLRKVEPLERALTGAKGWITGLRGSQSDTRQDMKMLSYDENYGVVKFNPLFDWSADSVWDYIKQNNVPYNELYDQGFASIGCAPCTRAIAIGDDERSGRWWWEQESQKECGIHIVDGKIIRLAS